MEMPIDFLLLKPSAIVIKGREGELGETEASGVAPEAEEVAERYSMVTPGIELLSTPPLLSGTDPELDGESSLPPDLGGASSVRIFVAKWELYTSEETPPEPMAGTSVAVSDRPVSVLEAGGTTTVSVLTAGGSTTVSVLTAGGSTIVSVLTAGGSTIVSVLTAGGSTIVSVLTAGGSTMVVPVITAGGSSIVVSITSVSILTSAGGSTIVVSVLVSVSVSVSTTGLLESGKVSVIM